LSNAKVLHPLGRGQNYEDFYLQPNRRDIGARNVGRNVTMADQMLFTLNYNIDLWKYTE